MIVKCLYKKSFIESYTNGLLKLSENEPQRIVIKSIITPIPQIPKVSK